MSRPAEAVIELKRVNDGLAHNADEKWAIYLHAKIPGVEREWAVRIGHFEEGYESFAREFVQWFNSKTQPKETP